MMLHLIIVSFFDQLVHVAQIQGYYWILLLRKPTKLIIYYLIVIV